MTRTILALGSLLPPEMELLESKFNLIRLWREKDPEAVLQQYRNEVVAILSTAWNPVGRRLIESLPNLEIIAQSGVGIDNIDLAAAKEKQVAVTNTPDVLTDDTADVALALMLAVARRVCEADMFVRVGKWANGPMPLGVSLSGKTAGIVGLGRIGRAIARRCEAFGMTVAYNSRTKKRDASYEFHANVTALAAASDFLVVACEGGAETENLVDYRVLEALGSKGFLINIARGSVVNEEDLLVALRNGVIAGAGLDVFVNEPFPPESLFSMDKVVLLPHIGSGTVETRTKMGRLVVENLLAYFSGKPLLTPVSG